MALTVCMLLTGAAVLAAEAPAQTEAAPFTVRGMTFGMTLEQVIAAETAGRYELDNERTLGPVTFTKLEYEDVRENGVPCDVNYLFVNDLLVAAKINYDTDDIGFDQLKADLTRLYGESAGLDTAALGNGIYAVDDDGRSESKVEAWTSGDVMIVLEKDDDDLDVTYVDLAASYIK